MSIALEFSKLFPRPPEEPECLIEILCAPGYIVKQKPGECPDIECIKKLTTNSDKCPQVYQPVCGSDGKTYGNKCFARRAGVSVVSNSPCEQANDPSDCICIFEYVPVCGADNKTYGNDCVAKCAGVTVAYKGPCKPPVVPEQPPAPLPPVPKPGIPTKRPPVPRPGSGDSPNCLAVYTPVCDTATGKTYSNACVARKAGVNKYTNGECFSAGPGPQKPDNQRGGNKPPPGDVFKEPGIDPKRPKFGGPALNNNIGNNCNDLVFF